MAEAAATNHIGFSSYNITDSELYTKDTDVIHLLIHLSISYIELINGSETLVFQRKFL